MNKKDVQIEVVIYPEEEGSVQRIVLNNPENYELVSKAQKAAFIEMKKKQNARGIDRRGLYLMSRNQETIGLEKTNITVTDRRYFMQLALYAQLGGKPLMKNGKPLVIEDIAEIWGVAKENASRRISKFRKLKLIERVGTRPYNYVLNEMYFVMGEGKIGKTEKFVKLFKNKLSEVIKNVEKIEKRRIKNPKCTKNVHIMDVIGLLHAVMPYFHYQTYYLVRNPDEDIRQPGESILDALENRDVLQHLTQNEIGQILGNKESSRNTIKNYMDRLQEAGALMIMESRGQKRYYIHPDLMFRLHSDGEDDYTRYVRAQFKQHGK